MQYVWSVSGGCGSMVGECSRWLLACCPALCISTTCLIMRHTHEPKQCLFRDLVVMAFEKCLLTHSHAPCVGADSTDTTRAQTRSHQHRGNGVDIFSAVQSSSTWPCCVWDCRLKGVTVASNHVLLHMLMCSHAKLATGMHER